MSFSFGAFGALVHPPARCDLSVSFGVPFLRIEFLEWLRKDVGKWSTWRIIPFWLKTPMVSTSTK